MIAFAGAAAAEVATGKGIVEQAAEHPVLITFMVFLLTVAGFMPKLASGVSLSTLLDASGALKTAYGTNTSVSTLSFFHYLAGCAAFVCFCISWSVLSVRQLFEASKLNLCRTLRGRKLSFPGPAARVCTLEQRPAMMSGPY